MKPEFSLKGQFMKLKLSCFGYIMQIFSFLKKVKEEKNDDQQQSG